MREAVKMQIQMKASFLDLDRIFNDAFTRLKVSFLWLSSNFAWTCRLI